MESRISITSLSEKKEFNFFGSRALLHLFSLFHLVLLLYFKMQINQGGGK